MSAKNVDLHSLQGTLVVTVGFGHFKCAKALITTIVNNNFGLVPVFFS